MRPKVALEGKGHIPKSLPSLRPAVKPKVQQGTHTCIAVVDNAINTPLFRDYPHTGCFPLPSSPPHAHPQSSKCSLCSRPGSNRGVLPGHCLSSRCLSGSLALRVSTICRQESLLSEPQTHAVEEWRKGCQPCWTVTLLDTSKGSPEFLSQQPGSTLSATHEHHGPGVTVKWRSTWAGLLRGGSIREIKAASSSNC